eukprot:4121568-Heterocapsa_arctica.AAC.1
MGVFRPSVKESRFPTKDPRRPKSNWQVKDGTWENSSDPDVSLHAVGWERDLDMRTMFDCAPLRDAWVRGRSTFRMAWMLTCTMLQAAYNIYRDNLGTTAPDIKGFQIQCSGRKQLTTFGGYMYEQMTLKIAMYLRTFLTNELLNFPGWA